MKKEKKKRTNKQTNKQIKLNYYYKIIFWVVSH